MKNGFQLVRFASELAEVLDERIIDHASPEICPTTSRSITFALGRALIVAIHFSVLRLLVDEAGGIRPATEATLHQSEQQCVCLVLIASAWLVLFGSQKFLNLNKFGFSDDAFVFAIVFCLIEADFANVSDVGECALNVSSCKLPRLEFFAVLANNMFRAISPRRP